LICTNLYSSLFTRKLRIILQAGLLACPILAAFPTACGGQWQGVPKRIKGLTATGIAPVFHGIPF